MLPQSDLTRTRRHLGPTRIWIALFLGGLAAFIGLAGIASAQIAAEPLTLPIPLPVKPGDNPALTLSYVQVITANVPVYSQITDAAAGVPPARVLGSGYVWLSLADPQPIVRDNQIWYRLHPDGYVRADWVTSFEPSKFQGAALAATPAKPLAWVVFGARVSESAGALPDKNAPRLAKYTLVTILEEKQVGAWTWYRVGDNQWIEQRQVGIVKPSPRPEGVGPTDKWIEVNLFEQTLAAYEGDRMVYATLVSSGLPAWPTPTGLFRIWVKVAMNKMSGREGYPDYYYLEDVPWIMYFNQSVALHGEYWHDKLGSPHSHGCVNLSPLDAKWLYDWTTPTASPSGWTLPTAENPGTWVWVH